MLVDGRRVDTEAVVTQRGRDRFSLGAAVARGAHRVRVVWYAGGQVVAALDRRLRPAP